MTQSHCESSPGSLDEYSGSWSDFITWTILKIHDWLIDWQRRRQMAANLQTKPNNLGCESPFVIITQPISWYLFYRPAECRRLSRPIALQEMGVRL